MRPPILKVLLLVGVSYVKSSFCLLFFAWNQLFVYIFLGESENDKKDQDESNGKEETTSEAKDEEKSDDDKSEAESQDEKTRIDSNR